MSQRTALVVDDSRSARFALRKYLESRSIKVETADSAGDAYLFLNDNKPDMIFLDHVMPGEDGFSVLHWIRANPATAHIPVVMCCAHESGHFAEQARSQGASGVMQKPPSPEQLTNILAKIDALIAQPAEAAEATDSPATVEPAPTELGIEAAANDEAIPAEPELSDSQLVENRRVETILQDEIESLASDAHPCEHGDDDAHADNAATARVAALESQLRVLEQRLGEADEQRQAQEKELLAQREHFEQQMRALRQDFVHELQAATRAAQEQTLRTLRHRLLQAFDSDPSL